MNTINTISKVNSVAELRAHLPTTSEFVYHVKNSGDYSQKELSVIEEYCPKAGYENVNDYLTFMFSMLKCMDLNVIDSFSNEFIDSVNFGSNGVVNYHNMDLAIALPSDVLKRIEKASKKAEKFPKGIKDIINKVELRFSKTVALLALRKFSKEPAKLKIIHFIFKKYFYQKLKLQPESVHYKDMVEFIDSFSNVGVENVFEGLLRKSFYFPEIADKLLPFQDALVNIKRIERNEYFSENFYVINPKSNKLTLWVGKQPELIYMVYIMCGRQRTYKDLRPSQIANNLFRFQSSKTTESSLNSAWNKLIPHLDDKAYLSKRFSDIERVLGEVGIAIF